MFNSGGFLAVGFLGLDAVWWAIIVPAFIAVLLFVLGKIKWGKSDSDHLRKENERLHKLLDKTLDKVPSQLDPERLPERPEKFDDLKKTVDEHIQKGGYVNAEDLLRMGNVEMAICNYDQALHYYVIACSMAESKKDKKTYANALGNIGLLHYIKGNSDEALKNHKAALKIDREIGYRQGEANQLGNIGLIYSDKGDLDEALKNLQDALAILDEHGLIHGRDVITNAIDEIKQKQRGEAEDK